MYLHNDELLYDPLPQPYRFINKILLQCIEDAIDLAEGGGKAEALNSIVSHNLRLTKVGKIPITPMPELFLSTTIANHEISAYSLLGETQYLVCGTSQGLIIVFDSISKSILYSTNITTLSKFAQQNPITKLICFETDHDNYIISFATEDIAFLLFFSSTFTLLSSIELDISLFNYDTLELKYFTEPYIILTDGTGRTSVYNCHTPSELISVDNSSTNSSKGSQPKQVQLEPILEIEKCPISAGPISSETQIATKTEEIGNKKKSAKKKGPPIPKGRTRSKSPGTQAIENLNPIETTQYQSTIYIFESNAIIRFGNFPLLLLYKLGSPSQLSCEFPIPSPVSASLEVQEGQHLILGFENGSFCFLNVNRKTLHDHMFPKQGTIKSIHLYKDILVTFSEAKIINVYRINSKFKIVETLLTCSDDDILQTNLFNSSLITYNQKSSDINLVNALTGTINWEGRSFKMYPNCSIINSSNGIYNGTISTPINIELVKLTMSKKYAAFIYNDPIEYRQLTTPIRGPSPIHGKRGISPKITKPIVNNKKGKANPRLSKKTSEETKEIEQETSVVIKRHIIGIVNFETAIEYFNKMHDTMEKEKTRRREMIKLMATNANYEEEEGENEGSEFVDESFVNTQNNIIMMMMKKKH